jgi:hypothetical protein
MNIRTIDGTRKRKVEFEYDLRGAIGKRTRSKRRRYINNHSFNEILCREIPPTTIISDSQLINQSLFYELISTYGKSGIEIHINNQMYRVRISSEIKEEEISKAKSLIFTLLKRDETKISAVYRSKSLQFLEMTIHLRTDVMVLCNTEIDALWHLGILTACRKELIDNNVLIHKRNQQLLSCTTDMWFNLDRPIKLPEYSLFNLFKNRFVSSKIVIKFVLL